MNYKITQVWYSDLTPARPNPDRGDKMICDGDGQIYPFTAPIAIDRIVGQKLVGDRELWLMQANLSGQNWFSWGLREAIEQ